MQVILLPQLPALSTCTVSKLVGQQVGHSDTSVPAPDGLMKKVTMTTNNKLGFLIFNWTKYFDREAETKDKRDMVSQI